MGLVYDTDPGLTVTASGLTDEAMARLGELGRGARDMYNFVDDVTVDDVLGDIPLSVAVTSGAGTAIVECGTDDFCPISHWHVLAAVPMAGWRLQAGEAPAGAGARIEAKGVADMGHMDAVVAMALAHARAGEGTDADVDDECHLAVSSMLDCGTWVYGDTAEDLDNVSDFDVDAIWEAIDAAVAEDPVLMGLRGGRLGPRLVRDEDVERVARAARDVILGWARGTRSPDVGAPDFLGRGLTLMERACRTSHAALGDLGASAAFAHALGSLDSLWNSTCPPLGRLEDVGAAGGDGE